MSYENSLDFAKAMDRDDPLRGIRSEFHFPQLVPGEDAIYLCGNSLGLQPKKTKQAVNQELDDWARFGVEGHFLAQKPWIDYHESVSQAMAEVVGAQPDEVVCMNSLTVNLHLMMVSFYRPTPQRYKILIEKGAFPSDQYAVASQLRFHGFDPETALIEVAADEGSTVIAEDTIVGLLKDHGDEIALVMLGG